MTLTTVNLDTGAAKPKPARPNLRDLMQRVIDLAAPGGAALVGGGHVSVRSIVAVRLLKITSASKYALVTQYHSEVAGGGGFFALDEADNTSLDDNATVIVANDGGRWKLVHIGSVSIAQFGAKSGGTVSANAAILAAVTWCRTQAEVHVNLQASVSIIDAQLARL